MASKTFHSCTSTPTGKPVLILTSSLYIFKYSINENTSTGEFVRYFVNFIQHVITYTRPFDLLPDSQNSYNPTLANSLKTAVQ